MAIGPVARAATRTQTYDRLGHLATLSDHAWLWSGSGPLPAALHTTSFEHDAFGNRTKLTDDKGRVTDFAFDGRDRLVSVTQQGNGDAPNLPAPLVTAFEYDAAGNVTRVTDPAHPPTVYDYDLLSRLGSVQQPEGETVQYFYDARSRLERVINARSQVLRHFYHPWGGIERVVHDLTGDGEDAGDRKVSYTYDANGNVTSTRDTLLLTGEPDGRLYTFSYDALDRLDTATAHYIPGEPILDSGYDRFGNRSALTLADGETLLHQWAHDRLGRLLAACLPQDQATPTEPCVAGGATQTLGFTPLGNDRLNLLTHGNGLVTDIDYQPYGPIQQIAVGSSPFPQQLVYTVDELLNVDTIEETQNGSVQSPFYDFDYDAVYRLTGATYPTGLDLPPGTPGEAFEYDPAGNREKPGDAGAYEYDANNQLTKSPASPVLCYDDDGNLTTKRSDGDCSTGTVSETFTWDAINRLSGFGKAGTSAGYAYDPFGRRIQKTLNGTPTWYLWDGDQLLAEYDGSGARQVRYAYAGGFAPVQVAYANGASENIYDVHSDHLDTPRMLTDSAGVPSWRASYEAFGRAHVSTDPDGSVPTQDPEIDFNIRFPGQYYDAESGLHYNRFRYYDASTGRYISADPIGQDGGANTYLYARNRPINWVDPHGLDVFFNFGKPGAWHHSWVSIGGSSPTGGSTSQSFGAYPLDAPDAKFGGIWGGSTQVLTPDASAQTGQHSTWIASQWYITTPDIDQQLIDWIYSNYGVGLDRDAYLRNPKYYLGLNDCRAFTSAVQAQLVSLLSAAGLPTTPIRLLVPPSQ